MIRSPICTVVGHVDHGKTTLLDTIRGTATAAGEAGAITQAIGASIIPIKEIQHRAGNMLSTQKITIPGLLFIDTPGHAAFSGMRKRGGSLADIAILLVDLNEGFMPQTREALEILKNYRTPFVVAANKVDLSPGFVHREKNILKDIQAQQPNTITHIETKIYELVGVLAEYGMPSERFDRLESFEKQVAIVPMSAKMGYGMDSLLALLVGLAQRYLEKNLDTTIDGPARGSILEVSEETGLGLTINAIIYDGTLRVGDTIVIGTLGEPVVTKVRALLQPAKGDLRDKKTKFERLLAASAATGVKISAPNIDNVTAGMPFEAVFGSTEKLKKEIKKQIEQVTISTDTAGIILKADNIGSLEALIMLLREKNIRIRQATVGPIGKKDIAVAAAQEEEFAVILGFNIEEVPSTEDVRIITSPIIYTLIDEYQVYQKELMDKQKVELVKSLVRGAKVRVLEKCIFRASNPLICGVEVLGGILKPGARIVSSNDPDSSIAILKEIQDRGEILKEAKRGDKVAINLPGATGGRHVHEGDILFTAISEQEFAELKKHAAQLTEDEKDILKEFAELKRKKNPLWGV